MPSARFVVIELVVTCLPWLLFPFSASAKIASCTASVSPNSASYGDEVEFTLNIVNPSDQGIVWINISKPSGNYTLVSCGGPWNCSTGSSDVNIPVADIGAGSNGDITVIARIADNGGSATNWSVQVADQLDGSNSTGCTGSLDVTLPPSPTDIPSPDTTATPTPATTTVTVTAADTTGPTVSLNPLTSSVYSTTPTITGQTIDDKKVSSAEYTLDQITWYPITLDSQTKTSTFKFTPSISKSGIYTIKVRVRDSSGNYGANSSITISIDLTPPDISISTNLSRPFTASPEIFGSATDKSGVTLIEYSADTGINWLPVQIINHTATQYNFSFTPKFFDDGNYPLLIRATDTTGNTNVPKSNQYQLIIDRLPPLIGQGLIAFGPQILLPSLSGHIVTLSGISTTVFAAASGGPISVSLTAPGLELGGLEKQSSTDLWTNTLNIHTPGTYPVSADSVDGAGNQTSRQLFTINVLPPGKVKAGDKAIVKVYIFDNTAQKFILWDGAPYGINNPQNIDSEKNYYFILPSGKYFLEASCPLFRTSRTTIFELTGSTPVNPSFTLNPSQIFNFGPITIPVPNFSTDTVSYTPDKTSGSEKPNPLRGQSLPKILLHSGASTISTTELIGKPQVITFLSTWNPGTAVQIDNLQKAVADSALHAIIIVPNESPSRAYLFRLRGNYSIPIYSDPDGLLITPLDLFSSPTHLFVNSSGIIEKVIVGLLTPADFIHNITN